MASLVAQYDWSKTPLGPREDWPRSLTLVVELILAAGFPMAVRWGPDLIMIYNDAYREILGDKHPGALGRPLREVWSEIHDELGPLNEAILQGRRRAYYSDDQVWRVQRYGLRFEDAHFALSYSPIVEDSAPNGIGGVLVTAVETTARFDSEQALRRLTLSLETEIAQRTRERDRIWQVSEDLLGVSNFDGYFLAINPAWTTLLGWSEREIKSMHVNELRHPDDAAHSTAGRQKLAENVTTVHMENRFRHKDGSWRWIHWTMTSEAGLIYVIGRNVTTEKLAIEALRQSERQFRLLVDGVSDHAIYMLDRGGTVASWNSGAQRIKGYAADEIIGEHVSTFYVEADRAAGLPEAELAHAAREGRYESEGWRVRKDGSRFWATAVIEAIRDGSGELVGFAKVTRDSTERRNTELALEQTRRQAANAQKMEALGQLTGGVAHDFNNMLMVIGGQAQMLKRRLSDPRSLRSIGAIELAAERGATLTRQLLAFSRRQALNPTPIHLQSRFEEFRDILTTSVRDNIRLTIEIGPQVWPVAVDVSELQLALVNIVINARDAMPDGGAITIKAENLIVIRGSVPDDIGGEFVAVRIADTGAGIPEDVLPRIFEPFFTTKQHERGTGLGLSQVYGFARQSGGTVAIASAPGRGTTVTLYLPRTTRPVIEADRAAAAPQRSTDDRTILVVEDNPQVAEVTADLIGGLGYGVISADCAANALAVLQSGRAVDLVLSDVVLPGDMDGFKLAQQIEERYPRVPVLLTTGYSASILARSDRPILRKPYQLAALASAIRGAMAATGSTVDVAAS